MRLRTAGVLLAVLLLGVLGYGLPPAHVRAADTDSTTPPEATQEGAQGDLASPPGALSETTPSVAAEAPGVTPPATSHTPSEGTAGASPVPPVGEATLDRNPSEGVLDAVALSAAVGTGVDDVSLYDGSTYGGAHTARVDANIGSYLYTVPITAPPGRNGIGPDLILSYNSSAHGDAGVFGYGWTSSIPYIERFNKLGVQDLYTRTDFYSSLDGELVWDTGNTYRPKYEQGAYRRYVLTNNTWTVYEKDGEALTFGRATSTRQYRPSNPAHTVRWWLEEKRDTNSNYATYAYYAADNQIYPESITYTGNGTTPGMYRIEFTREARGDNLVSYAYGYAATTSFRISGIQVRANGALVRSYALTYGTGANGTRSLLTSVTETGYDEGTGLGTSLPERSFSYTNGGDKRWSALECGAPVSFIGGGDDMGIRFGDVNGDGLVDILYAARHGSDASTNVIYLNQGGHCRWATSTLTVPLPPGNSTGFVEVATDPNRDQGGRVVDVNGDGLVDVLWYREGSGSYAYINTGNGWAEQDTWRAPQFMTTYGRDAGVLFEDVNGDGLTDFLKSWQDGGVVSPHKFVYFNTGSGWTQAPSSWDIPTLFVYGSGDRGVRVFDVNGDGLADITQGMFDRQYDPDLDINKVWLNTGGGWASSTYSLPVYFNSGGRDNNARLADLNGDGLEDILRLTSDNYSKRAYLNTGKGWYEASWVLPDMRFSDHGDTGLRLLDLNGDAVFDLSKGAGGTWRFDGAKVDLLERVVLPEGGSLGVSYKQTPLYTGADGVVLLNPNLPLNLDTVSTFTEEDGRGGVAVTSYTYAGGAYATQSIPDRRFAGFATTTVADPFGNKTVTYYHQGNGSQTALGEYQDHVSKIGKPYRTEQYDASNNLYRTTVNRWDRYALNATSSFVKLATTTLLAYDGNSDHRDSALDYTYDTTYGNLTKKTEYGEVAAASDGTFTDTGTDKRTADIAYAASTTPYIVGLPKQETLKNSAGTIVADTKYYYDTLAFGAVGKGNRTKTERWVSGTTWVNDQKAYNAYGLVTSETDPRGKVTTYTYDAYNLFPATTTNPLGHTTYRQYDLSSGSVTKLKDPQGLWYETVYDGLDRVTAEKQPDTFAPSTLVTKTRYEYTDTRGETRVKRTDELDAANARDAYRYFDGLGRLVQTRTEGEGVDTYVTTDRVYNERGQLKAESLPYFSVGTASTSPTATTALLTRYTYDALGRPSSLVNAAGTTTYAYDQWETVVTDPNGHPRDLHRDAYDRLAKVEEHNAAATYTTLYDYDALDSLTKVTDAASNIRAFTYDGLSRRTRAEDLHASGDTTYGVYLFAYDAAGNVSSTTNPRGQAVAYTYDNGNRVLTEDYLGQSGTEVSYRYDTCTYGKGRLCVATSTGAAVSYTYDALGRVATETEKIAGASYATGYRYDRAGALTALTYPDQSEVRYLYDASGRLDAIERKELGQSPLTLERYLTYTPTDALEYEEYGDGSYVYSGYDPAERYRLRYRANVAYDTGTWGSGVAAMGGAEDAAAPAGLTAARARYAAYAGATHRYDGTPLADTTLPIVHLSAGASTPRTPTAPERAYYARTRTATSEAQPVRSHAAPARTAGTATESASGAAMASLLASVNPPAASQRMQVEGAWRTTTITDNRSFEAGTDRWTYWGDSGSTLARDCTSASNGSCSFKVYSASPGNEWDVVLEQEGLRIDPGVTYRIVFDAKANATSSLYSLVGQDHAPWYTYGHATFVTVTPQWKTYTYTFRSTATTSDERSVLYFGFGQGQGTFNVDNVRLVPDDQDLIRNPSFEGGTIGGWYFGGAGATSSVPCVGAPDGVCAMKATLTQAGQYWGVEFSHGGMAVATGTTYLFSFDAKAAAARTLYVELGQAHAPWNLLAPTVVAPLTSAWTHYVFKLTANASDTNARIGFYMGNSTTSLWLDNVRFAEAVPTKVTDMTPEFSARYDDPDAGDTATSYRVQVDYTWGDFSAPVWDSGKLTMASVPEGVRTADLSYAGPTLYPDGTRYRWRIKLWDESGNEGPYTNGEDYFYTAGDKVQQATYAYDPAGNITQIVDDVEGATGKNQVYTYDDLDRLTGASVGSAWPHYVNGRFSAAAPGASIRSYTYSPLGNITSASDLGTYTYAGTGYANPHALTSVNGQTYTYDNAGNVTADGTRTNTWDYQNRLTQTLKSGTTYRSTYDHAGQRTAHYDGTATTTFPNKYYEQRGGVITKHLYRPDGTLIATVTGTGTAATLRYIHTDHLGGTKAVTDANGRVEMLDYYPYGGTRVDEQSSSYAERRKYIGGEYDTGTGLYYLEARYQNPVTGRFVSEDPVFTAVGDVGALRERGISLNEVLADPQLQNSYSYGSNNPLKNVDANGEWIDTVVDVGFAAHSLYTLGVAIATGGDVKGEAINFGLDVGGMAIPGVVGLGTARRVATKADNVARAVVHTHTGSVAGDVGEGIIYLRTNPLTGERYVGQSKNFKRYIQRQMEHDRSLKVTHEFEIINRAKQGQQLDFAEETAIRNYGGLRSGGGELVNKRHQMSETRYQKANNKVD